MRNRLPSTRLGYRVPSSAPGTIPSHQLASARRRTRGNDPPSCLRVTRHPIGPSPSIRGTLLGFPLPTTATGSRIYIYIALVYHIKVRKFNIKAGWGCRNGDRSLVRGPGGPGDERWPAGWRIRPFPKKYRIIRLHIQIVCFRRVRSSRFQPFTCSCGFTVHCTDHGRLVGQ